MQATLEGALTRVTQEDIHVVGSGRTDAGAHAVSQVVAFSTETVLRPEVLQRAANAVLPRSVAITSACDVPNDFHPRFDALSRLYRYVIWNRSVRSPFWEGRSAHVKPTLDAGAMHRSLQVLVGRQSFASFVPANYDGSSERTVSWARCWRDGWTVNMEIEAEGFMRQMVRSIAGTLIDVGRGKIDPEQFSRIVRARDRTEAGRTAPACGLYLMRVRYDNGEIPGQSALDTSGAVPHHTAPTSEEKQ